MDFILDIETTALKPGETLTEDGKDIGALSPITGRVTAIGFMVSEPIVLFDEDEKKLLETFWNEVAKASISDKGYIRFIGFNIRQFDMHFLLVRSLHHNITLPHFSRKVVDLRDVLTFGNSYRKKGTLGDYGKLIGLNGKFEEMSGEKAAQLFHDKGFEKLKDYLKHDILLTKQLYDKCLELKVISYG